MVFEGTRFHDLTLTNAGANYLHYVGSRPPLGTISAAGFAPSSPTDVCVRFPSCEIGGRRLADETYYVFQPFTVSGRLYDDSDGDGFFDAGEAVLANKQVGVMGLENTFTDENGFYSLDALFPGTLTFFTTPTLSEPDDWVFTSGRDLTAQRRKRDRLEYRWFSARAVLAARYLKITTLTASRTTTVNRPWSRPCTRWSTSIPMPMECLIAWGIPSPVR